IDELDFSDESDDLETPLQIWRKLTSLNGNDAIKTTDLPEVHTTSIGQDLKIVLEISGKSAPKDGRPAKKKLVKIQSNRNRRPNKRAVRPANQDFFIDDDSPPVVEESSNVSLYSLRSSRIKKARQLDDDGSEVVTSKQSRSRRKKRGVGSSLLDTPQYEDEAIPKTPGSPQRHLAVEDSDSATDCDEALTEIDGFVTVVNPVERDADKPPEKRSPENPENPTALHDIFFNSKESTPKKPPPRQLLKQKRPPRRKVDPADAGCHADNEPTDTKCDSKSLWDDDTLWNSV
uniref:Uncharacterized protein n=1 Tax=Ciona savignyi TaxID=51511 RepID=H2YQQ5_CIOSA